MRYRVSFLAFASALAACSTPDVTPVVTPDGGSPASDSGPPASCADALPPLKLTQVATSFTAPVLVTNAGDSRLFVVEQGGTIRVVKGGVVAPAPFLDVSSVIVSGGERGLLGLAFHPSYAQNGRFFVHYSGAPDGHTVIAEYKRSAASEDLAEGAIVKEVFTVAQPFANHNGGQIAFGPDGYLYIGLGDGGSANDPNGNGQSLATKLGKILRIDVDTYPTPPSGNMTGDGVDPSIWDYGIRNPWRFSFDRANGDLYIGDVGQNTWEEIDYEPKGAGNRNYGWSITEGLVCRPPATSCAMTGITPPVAVHPRTEAQSITGGYVYRGAALPCLAGRYVYADYVEGRIFSFVIKEHAATANAELTAMLNPGSALKLAISSFGEDSAGELYMLNYAAGTLYRIDAQ